MTYIAKFYKNSLGSDSDDLAIYKGEERVGFAFIGKESKKLGLMRCPACKTENYAMSVMTGTCAWCGFASKPLNPSLTN